MKNKLLSTIIILGLAAVCFVPGTIEAKDHAYRGHAKHRYHHRKHHHARSRVGFSFGTGFTSCAPAYYYREPVVVRRVYRPLPPPYFEEGMYDIAPCYETIEDVYLAPAPRWYQSFGFSFGFRR